MRSFSGCGREPCPVPSTPERREGLRACYWEGPSELLERRSSSSAPRRPQTTSTRLYAGGELQGSPVWQALAPCRNPRKTSRVLLQCVLRPDSPTMTREQSRTPLHTWFFSSCGGILELRRGSQPSPWVGPGKPNLPLGLRGKACSRVIVGESGLKTH